MIDTRIPGRKLSQKSSGPVAALAATAATMLLALTLPASAEPTAETAGAPVEMQAAAAQQELLESLATERAALADLRAAQDILQKELSQARIDLAARGEERALMRAEITDLETQLSATQAAASETRAERDTAQHQITALRTEITDLETQLSAAKAAASETRAERDSTQAEVARLRGQMGTLQTRLTSAEAAAADAQGARDTAISEITAQQAARVQAEGVLSASLEQLAAAEAEVARLRSELAEAGNQMAAERRAAAQARSASEAQQGRIARLEQEIASIRAAGEQELAVLRGLLPANEGGTLSGEAAQAHAATTAAELRAAHRATRPGRAISDEQRARIDEAAKQLRRDQSLVSRAQGGSLYEVKSGETLAIIAARFYGDGNLWPRVYRDNQHVLENPDQVWPGMTLIIP